MTKPEIIFKDRHILVIDKPAGMPSVSVSGGRTETLQDWILENFPKQKKISKDAGLVNRLDNDTSGIIVAARMEKAYEFLKEVWTTKNVTKEYIALVVGKTPPSGKVSALIAHHPDKKDRMITVLNLPDAKKLKARNAETEYKVLEYYLDYTLLKVKITAGVRHQIRCHLASIGYPVSGDKLYQKPKHGSRDWIGLTRHFLHSSRVAFPHPSTGKIQEFTSELPAELKDSLPR